MKSQIFKKNIPIQILINLFEKISKKHNSYYIISKSSFQQVKYHNLLEPFCEELKQFYYPSKLFYIMRTLDYSKFLTILRQIYKYHNMKFTSKIVYNKSTYDILYHFYTLNEGEG